MIILQMSGGLGNQMFQYALYLKLKSLGKEVKFDDVETYLLDNARPIQLNVFRINYPRATREEIIEMTDGSLALKDRIRRKLTGRKTKEYREDGFRFDPKVLEVDPAYLVGVFQSERYFKDIEQQVREAFRMDTSLLTPATLELQQEIDSVNAVCLHVRRGDYLATPEVYGEICTDAYYDGAIEMIKQKYPDAVFYLFTNDQPWANFFMNARKDTNIRLVKGNTEYTGFLDLYLMQHCKHFIIANSSFSWWGSWLCEDPNKTVIAPARWFQDRECPDIYTDDMIIVNEAGHRVRKVEQLRL